MRGVNHARVLGASAYNRRRRYIYQGYYCESLQWPITFAGSTKVWRGFQRLWFALVLVFLFMPSNALALTAGDMGVVWGPNPVGRWGSGETDELGVICVADNAFNAALVTCGIQTNDERLTAEAKAKLSNESSGGSFYSFAQDFSCFQGNDGYDYPTWNRAATGVVDSMANLFGPENVWWGLYESYLFTSAKEDLETVLAGGSLGGGSGSGSGGVTGDYITFECKTFYSTRFNPWTNYVLYAANGTQNYTTVLDGNQPYNADNIIPSVFYVNVPSTYFDGLQNFNIDNVHYCISLTSNNYYNNNLVMQIFAFSGEIYTITEQQEINGVTQYIKNFVPSVSNGYILNIGRGKEFTFDGTTITVTSDNNTRWDTISTNSSGQIPISYRQNGLSKSVNVIPPTQWPETEPTTPITKPVVPDPPDVTAPDVPTYDPKSYTNPVTTTNPGDTYNSTTINNYTYNYDTYTATGEDVIPYLQAILNAINALAHNLSAYMLNVQSLINNVITSNNSNASQIVAKLGTIITAINNASTTINGGIGELDTDINSGLGEIYDLIGDFQGAVHNEFRSLKSYLKSLFQWLANQFDFTFDGGDYDDSSILYWLRRIYYKLGVGRVNTRPTDPVADPVGIGDWLAQLFRNFLGGLLGIGGEALDAVLDALDDLRNKFPFSIPWDLAAILGLLVADPVAPNFDVPQYTITTEGLQQVATYHIDLSVFDDVMVGVRTMETLVFAFCLAFKTDFFKGLLTVHGGE